MTDPWFTDVHETDPGRAETALAPPGSAGPFVRRRAESPFTLCVRRTVRGPLDAEVVRCTDDVRLRLERDPRHVVAVPLQGMLHVHYRGREIDVVAGGAAVLVPADEATVLVPAGSAVALVRVPGDVLCEDLEALLGRTVVRPLRAGVPVPAATAPDALGPLAPFLGDVPGPDSVLGNALTAEPLEEAILDGVLHAADEPAREALDATAPSWGPRTVRACLDLIETYPERPHTARTLADGAGLSVRALQDCWQRHRGRTPEEELGRVRLERAHRDLEELRRGEATVASVATAWGFRHEDFTARYEMRYGRSPEVTLGSPAFA
ncbi:helix-turn-helix transcriptional regulator [Pseudonocardia yuanmonensis]|uniref:helix-turn-helix transcriptional regulator n=1 Tax=Pseudonocardia yuanmonensis TaxID=1095914 RepID=UPI0031E9892F